MNQHLVQCNFCNRKFENISRMEKQIKKKHEDYQSYDCDKRGKEICDKIEITEAQKNAYKCKIQTMSFGQLYDNVSLGEGAVAAAGRRDLTRRLEEGRRRDRQASYMAHIRGRGLSREGQIFVQQMDLNFCWTMIHFLFLVIFSV